jgi:hypothetical protein
MYQVAAQWQAPATARPTTTAQVRDPPRPGARASARRNSQSAPHLAALTAHLLAGAWLQQAQERQAVVQGLASLSETVDTVIANLQAADPTEDAEQLAATLAQLAALKQNLTNMQAQ